MHDGKGRGIASKTCIAKILLLDSNELNLVKHSFKGPDILPLSRDPLFFYKASKPKYNLPRSGSL